MRVVCTASSLVVRALPGGVDINQRLRRGEFADAVGQSFDGKWYFVVNPSVAGWCSKEFLELEEVEEFDPLVAQWIGAAEGNYRKGRALKIEMIVIHVIEGTLKSCDNWFNDPAAEVSAHYGIGLKRELHQYVKETDTAHHAGRVKNPTAALVIARPGVNPNSYSIGIEHEGTATSVWPDTMYEDSARLVADIAKRHNIPLDRKHVVGHHEIYEPKPCPGKGDVDRIVALAKQFTV